MSLSGKVISLNRTDTIAAIATAPGPSGISVIRISGDEALSITDKIFYGIVKPSRSRSHTVHYGKIKNPSNQNVVDEVMLSIFLSPNSYTGENMTEISCHGGDYAAATILKLVNKLGARLAEPGEFTKRRVLAGKMDITQAEAVLDIVEAKNELHYRSALQQLSGCLSDFIQDLQDELTNIVAQLENLLEFEENQKRIIVEQKRLAGKLKIIRTRLEDTIRKNEQLKFIRSGIYAVIVGKPNVGKSSLFNRLCEADKAIVTPIPGTTRDSLEQIITIDGLLLHLVDTAGLAAINKYKPDKKIEAIGIKKAKNWLEAADLVLAVFDNSKPVSRVDKLIHNVIKTKPHFAVLNKIDLTGRFNRKILKSEKIFPISAKYNKGIALLRLAIKKYYARKSPHDNYLYLNDRHIATLNKTVSLINQAKQEKLIELSILNLRNALDTLSSVINPVTNEQILDQIFTKFCIGK